MVITLFGGKHPFLLSLLPAACGILLAATAWSIPISSEISQKWTKKSLFLTAFFVPLVLVLMLAIFQMVPLPLSSSFVNPFWSLVSTTYTPITLNPGQTLLYMGTAASYVAFAASAVLLSTQNGRGLIKTIAILTTVASFYGIFIFATGNHYVLWLEKTSYEDALSATFINRNSFATMAGLGILASLGLLLQRIGEISGRLSVRERWHAFWMLVVQQGWPWLLTSLVCFMALVLTNSRAGLAASVVGIVTFLLLLAFMRRPSRWQIMSMVAITATITGLILVTLGSSVGTRLTRVGSDAAVRDTIYTYTHQIIDTNPITGTGLGTFQESFSAVRTPEFYVMMRRTIEHAHNTYLELTSELGYPGIMLLGFSILIAMLACLYGLKTRRRAIAWPALGLSAMVLVGGHALADFSLSVPAVTLTAITMVALALANSTPSPVSQTGITLTPTARHILTAASLLLVIYGLWQSAANYYALRAEPSLASLDQEKTPNLPALRKTESNLRICLRINPYHPTCGFGIARISLTFAANELANKRPQGLINLQNAANQYQEALNNAPANTHAWFRLARIQSFLGDKPAAVTAMVNSLLTGPYEPRLAILRIPLMLTLMPEGSPENQSLFAGNINSLWNTVGWDVGNYLRDENPALQPAFAKFLGDSPVTRATWKTWVNTPFPKAAATPPPAPAPLGVLPENG